MTTVVTNLNPAERETELTLDTITTLRYVPPPKQILPRAPIINFPTVIPATTLPAEASATPHDSFTEMLQNWQPLDEVPRVVWFEI
ncbi:hypothetical protein E1301_Tti023785 [Triplophysa tibetana]|uniref:Uncharacterized protein n=1 Tax=Triplophysa tibetana TaxID=1572043 RepID=A0A5A9NTZ5_9TELE|nr:hypothetical protein E1301_Tti023785 [Triplophysa tibetana]